MLISPLFVMNIISQNCPLILFRYHSEGFVWTLSLTFPHTQGSWKLYHLYSFLNKGTQENVASMLRALRRGIEKQASTVFCWAVSPSLFSPREKKRKDSVQNKSGTLFKVTSGQDTAIMTVSLQIPVALDYGAPSNLKSGLPRTAYHSLHAMLSTCERGHSLANELWFISFSKSFRAFLTVVCDHCSGGKSSSLGQLFET